MLLIPDSSETGLSLYVEDTYMIKLEGKEGKIGVPVVCIDGSEDQCGAICDDGSFNDDAAKVVCADLGYSEYDYYEESEAGEQAFLCAPGWK